MGVPYWSRPLSLTPESSGHCLLSSPEPLLGGINPFLTPVLRLGGVVPKGGDSVSVGGCQQAALCPQQPCNRGTLGELGSRGGQGQEALTKISSCFISCSRGSPLPFSPVTTKEKHELPPKLGQKYVPLQSSTTLFLLTLPSQLDAHSMPALPAVPGGCRGDQTSWCVGGSKRQPHNPLRLTPPHTHTHIHPQGIGEFP